MTNSLDTGNAVDCYVVRCWKGDYWNLGAGAEIEIYDSSDISKRLGYCEIEPENLNLDVRMNVDYYENGFNEEPKHLTTDFKQTNWWVTSFSPKVQSPNINLLKVKIEAAFSEDNNPNTLMRDFYKEGEIQKSKGKWSSLGWVLRSVKFSHILSNCHNHPTQYTCSNPPCCKYDSNYQFIINY